MTTTLSKAHVWRGVYRDISFKIVHWGFSNKPTDFNDGLGTWNYYLYIPEEAFQPGDFEALWLEPKLYQSASGRGRVTYDYMDGPISGLNWHGGITYYAKLGGIDGHPRTVEAGCDYGHYWDRGHRYTVEEVEHDAKRSIDSLHARYPNLKRNCRYNGGWYDQDQGAEIKPGVWYSHDGKAANDEWEAEYAERQRMKEAA